jgi:ankyrin repeat protein
MELSQAVRDNDLDSVNRLLLNPKVDVNQTNVNGATPLIMAAITGNVEIGNKLIERGANINHAARLGQTPLILAVQQNRKDFVILLLEQPNININAVNIDEMGGATALMINVSSITRDRQDITDFAELLLESGADPNIPDAQGNTPLTMAVIHVYLELIKLLVKYGADVNWKNDVGKNLLMTAAIYPNVFSYLLTIPQLDIDATNNNGNTTLIYLVQQGLFLGQQVPELLAAGADPLIKNKSGFTARQYIGPAFSNADITKMLSDAEAIWRTAEVKALQDLQKKFMVARRLRQGVTTTAGSRLELPQRQLSESIIRKAEYSNLCLGLQSNLNKPGVIALAKSLNIKTTTNQTKRQLCNEISKLLII